MSKGGRKGRVSNQLVAASCAAILGIYAAGYWRTRDEARRFETQSLARRPVRPARPAPVTPAAVPSVAAAPVAALSPPEADAQTQGTPPAASEPRSAGKESPTVALASVTAPATVAEQAKPAVAAVMPIPAEPVPQPETASVAAAVAPPEPVDSPWHDGTYTGWGLSRHGDIEARVTIRNGGIVAASIATCATRYPCYVIDEILQQPLFRQSPDVDRVSRATESSDAYSDAVWQALQKAEAGPSATPAASP